MPLSTKAINITQWRNESDWAESGLRNGCRVGKSTCQPRGLIPIRRKQSLYVETNALTWVITKGRNSEYRTKTILENCNCSVCRACKIFRFLSRSCMRASVSCWRAVLTKTMPESTGCRRTAASVLPKFVAGYAMHSYSAWFQTASATWIQHMR